MAAPGVVLAHVLSREGPNHAGERRREAVYREREASRRTLEELGHGAVVGAEDLLDPSLALGARHVAVGRHARVIARREHGER